MIGAILGDVVGSPYEFHSIKSYDFPLISGRSKITDDSCMTMAVAMALSKCNGNYENLGEETIKAMREIGQKFPWVGYGGRFFGWILSDKPEPYNSCGNGCGMRVSPVGFVAQTLEECKELSRKVTEISHNHPEGIKGAEAIAVCIFMAKNGSSKEEIRDYVTKNYYKLDFTIDEIQPKYEFSELAQESVPQAIECFLESENFEDALRKCVYLGGDCDTTGAMAGAIAEAYYGLPEGAELAAEKLCPPEYFKYIKELEEMFGVKRDGSAAAKPILAQED